MTENKELTPESLSEIVEEAQAKVIEEMRITKNDVDDAIKSIEVKIEKMYPQSYEDLRNGDQINEWEEYVTAYIPGKEAFVEDADYKVVQNITNPDKSEGYYINEADDCEELPPEKVKEALEKFIAENKLATAIIALKGDGCLFVKEFMDHAKKINEIIEKHDLYYDLRMEAAKEIINEASKEECKPKEKTLSFIDYENVKLDIANYASDPMCMHIGIRTEEGIPVAPLTVNLGNNIGNGSFMQKYCAFIDTSNNGKAEDFIKENELGEPYTRFGEPVIAYSGFCEYPLYQFNADKLKEFNPKGCKAYEKEYDNALEEIINERFREDLEVEDELEL